MKNLITYIIIILSASLSSCEKELLDWLKSILLGTIPKTVNDNCSNENHHLDIGIPLYFSDDRLECIE